MGGGRKGNDEEVKRRLGEGRCRRWIWVRRWRRGEGDEGRGDGRRG